MRLTMTLLAGGAALALLAGCGGSDAGEGEANNLANAAVIEDLPMPENAQNMAADLNAAAPMNETAPAEEEAAANSTAPAKAEAAATPTPTAAATPAAKAKAEEAEAPAPKVQTAAASGPPAAFSQCRACHTVGRGEGHRVGPNLFGVVGAKAGTRPGYAYSGALKESGITWTRDRLDAFIQAPRAVVPGTKMVVAGPKDAARRAEIIDYLAAQR